MSMRAARGSVRQSYLTIFILSGELLFQSAALPATDNTAPPADSLYGLAAERMARGDSAAALPYLDRSLELDPGHGASLASRGMIYLKLGLLRQAWSDLYSASFDSSPGVRLEARLGLGDLYRSYGFRGLEAARQYRLALKVDPTSRQALYSLATTGFDLEDTQGYRMAARALAELICMDPEYGDVYSLWRDRIKDKSDEELRRVDSALADYIAAHPERGDWWLDIARDRYSLGDLAGARTALAEHARLAPGRREAGSSLLEARLRLESGDSLGFERDYNAALSSAARDSDFLDLFREAEPIFTPEERARWDSLQTPARKAAFFRTFWLRRDPDPFDSLNTRLIEHYRRLRLAETRYRLANPYSRFNTSRDYNRLLSPPGMLYDYDSDLFWQRRGALSLDQRGLLLVRHGPPDRIDRELTWEDPLEIWRYGSVRFQFVKRKGAGDFLYVPAVGSGVGDIVQAMSGDSYKDPLAEFSQHYYLVDFRGDRGGIELDCYQSAPAALCLPDSVPESALALYDSTWQVLSRDSRPSVRSVLPGDSLWIGMSRVITVAGKYIYAVRFGLSQRRSVDRGSLELDPYPEGKFELSSLVLGVTPPPGGELLVRRGVALLPRPDLEFRRGEVVQVFLEVYNLVAGLDREPSFREWVTVSRVKGEGAGWMSGLGRLFGWGGRARRSLTLTFGRTPPMTADGAAETFSVDTSPLDPGDYRILIEARDNATGRRVTRKVFFKIRDR